MKISVGIVDDHQLFLRSLGLMINMLPGFEVLLEALNGEALIKKLELSPTNLPDIILIDVNMPVMDGTKTARIISSRFPVIKLVALSMKDDDQTIINMLKAGCCAYLLKDITPEELEKGLHEISVKGYFYADVSKINYRRLILKGLDDEKLFSEKELIFLRLACSDKTYKQISAEMKMAERTIDGYRESLFEKLNVQSRVGMVLEALRRNLVVLEK